MEGISDTRDPDELWKRMKELQAANNIDAYYLLAPRAQELIETYVEHYGLCFELASAYGAQARDQATCRPGRLVAAIRSHHYYSLASDIALSSLEDVRILPKGWQSQDCGVVDRQTAQLRALREAAAVLLQLDWVDDAWKWQWVSQSLAPVVQAAKTYDEAHLNLGQAYSKLGELDRAEVTWREAQRLPNAAPELQGCLLSLRLARANRAAGANNWSEVIRILDGQCDLTPKELVVLGDAFQNTGQPDRARGTWQAALRGDPNEKAAQERLSQHQQAA